MLFDKEFSTLVQHAFDLNPYVSGTRYPDSHFAMPDVSLAEDSIASARFILSFVKDKLCELY